MKPFDSTREFSLEPIQIDEPAAADYLANPQRAVFLYPFIGRERCASEVLEPTIWICGRCCSRSNGCRN
ncbi:MAG: hypothetical protein HC933_21310 [Pleurocapsa sp. SU_196_0]|nr:hypothetical protein [Pleurocapsa sp. SU_196_0]